MGLDDTFGQWLTEAGAVGDGAGPAKGVQSVGPGVRHRGEVGEQFGHLDAEGGSDGEFPID
jgi:hypothetical protein